MELGLGTGWFEAEHRAYGISSPPLRERFEQFEEQLEIITGLWTTPLGTGYSFDGRHYQLADSPGLPKPVQMPRPPIVIGGSGTKQTPRLAALCADDFNAGYMSVEEADAAFARVDAACETLGRDPATLVHSSALTVCYGGDPGVVQRRAAAINRTTESLDGRSCAVARTRSWRR